MDKITKETDINVKWLLADKNNVLRSSELSKVVKILIEKVNELVDNQNSKP